VPAETNRSIVYGHGGTVHGLDERWRVRNPERPQGRCDEDEEASYAACGSTEVPAAWRLTANDLMYPLMREAKLLCDLA
jgi:hypothetical protein